MKNFRELIVWQKSMDFITTIYKISKSFPKDEQFGLTSQIRRAAVSVPSNIAEGFGRKSDGDFNRFLSISLGSNYEVQTQVEICRNLEFINENEYSHLNRQLEEIARMLKGLKSKIR